LREVPRIFHAAGQFEARSRIASHHHLQRELIVLIQFGMNRNQMDPRGHHFFQIFQHMRPGKRFALNQFVEKLGLVARRAILRSIEKFLGLLRFRSRCAIWARKFGDLGMVAPRREPVRDGVASAGQASGSLPPARAVPQRSQNCRASS
jgi:hypothetical protein